MESNRKGERLTRASIRKYRMSKMRSVNSLQPMHRSVCYVGPHYQSHPRSHVELAAGARAGNEGPLPLIFARGNWLVVKFQPTLLDIRYP